MPCSDVTEVLSVTLDEWERLKDYSFSKRTCGQGVGVESLLIDQLGGKSMQELLAYSADDFLREFPIGDEIEEFLSLKHLFAIQGALEVLTGIESGGKDDPFSASGVSYGENETVIEGLISVDLVTEKIKACGNCGTCGTDKVDEGRAINADRRAARA